MGGGIWLLKIIKAGRKTLRSLRILAPLAVQKNHKSKI